MLESLFNKAPVDIVKFLKAVFFITPPVAASPDSKETINDFY